MQLADAAADVLRRSGEDPLSVREIAEKALAEGLIAPRSQTPWMHMDKAMRKELRQLPTSGKTPRFERLPDGRYRAVS